MTTPAFAETDFRNALPPAGFYACTIAAARLRRSATGNRMLHVAYAMEHGMRTHDRVAEYLVLEGASPRGCALSRRLLVELYRACGLEPQPGDPIRPSDLVGVRLEVRVEHTEWQGEARLRVVGHRRLVSAPVTPAASGTLL